MAVALVTGANGFLGNYVCREILDRGYDVVRLSRGSTVEDEKASPLSAKPTASEICKIIDERQAAIVYHLAGTSQASDLEALYQANVFFAQSILSAAASAKSPPKVILIGSAAEYGRPVNSDMISRESDTCSPLSAYGISKLAQTHHGLAASEAGLCVTIARLFNPIGVGSPATTALGSFVRQIASMPTGGGILRTGSLHSTRDFIDVAEAASAIVRLSLLSDVQGKVYNVCAGAGVRLQDLVSQLIEVSGIAVQHQIESTRRGTSDIDTVIGSNDRLRSVGLDISKPDFRSVLEKMLSHERAIVRKS
ncbi:UDP-glucose 4-epimerase [Rhizobium freirei PRF 81]|uniref:UDP-glucose 4-epimerase n=1 Tax=Rhizobium freirei PRF 81 TaxID=363754 RepID=N6UR70_9HYPH|nr:NAD(P)-dependent oxidoreductase [Rhizobium freirei]ENN84220.1 UDP-glucose 4-epimerase [Rhizobium freirei PRF 81]